MSTTRAGTTERDRRIVFPGADRIELEAFDVGDPAPDEVVVRVVLSLMSTGTEGIVLSGQHESGSNWARYARFPFHPGYASIGIVETIGRAVTDLAPGSSVAVRRPHASRVRLPATDVIRIPHGVDPLDATWFAAGAITFRAMQAARAHIGEPVLIVGAGPIGQLCARWAYAAGLTPIIVVDPFPERLELAARGGATATLAAPIAEAVAGARDANDGTVPGVIIEATGNSSVFADVLHAAPDFGRIVLIGDPAFPSDQHLTSDLLVRGLTVVGAHDSQIREGWTGQRAARLFFSMLEAGRLRVDGLVTHTFAAEEAAAAYRLAQTDRRLTMGIVFDWR